MDNKKAVVIYSGGLDSLVTLHWALGEMKEIKAISFDYGQKHKKELDYAKRVTDGLDIEHKIVDVSFLKHLLSNSALTSDIEVPEGHYKDENMKITVVPNRNAIFLNIAIGWAANIGYSSVIIGTHAGDHFIYPDCRKEFISSMNTTSLLATKGLGDVEVLAPFVEVDKTEVVRMGALLGVSFVRSWSCYKGGTKHCGKCATCVERKEAFKLSGVEDPTEYEN